MNSKFKKSVILLSISILIICTFSAFLLINNTNKEKSENIKREQNSGILELNSLIDEAEYLKRGYYIDEAVELLNSSKYSKNRKVKSKISEYENYKSEFIKYDGDIEHIFFHSLIIYPKLAFDDKGHLADGYNMWFATVEEFKRMLPLLEERGYILVKTSDIFAKDINDKIIKKDLYLPKGKKPLVISQDDVNYYNYMKPDGFAEKLVLTEDSKIATLVKNLENKYEVTMDGDIVPILDEYISNNPEFSYKGAKGILAVTGYEGVFGYRLESKEDVKEAQKVSCKLRENGWEIASHSYTHNGKGFFGENPVYENLKYDFNKWNEIIRDIVGETDIFIAPYGTTLDGENFNLSKSNGFNIYCNVYRKSETINRHNTFIMSRFNIDGFTMFNHKEEINRRFFDVDKVIDKNRPILK